MIIGVAGEKKHGKDTVASYLKTKYGYTQRAFADNLKEVCSQIFEVPLPDMYDENLKEAGFDKPVEITLTHVLKLMERGLLANEMILPSELHRIVHKLWWKKSFSSIRDMLQFVGTDILRDEVDRDYHYNTVIHYFRENQVLNGVISDVRFPNERHNLKVDFKQAKTILVVRPSLQRNATSSHASETSLGDASEYDYVVMNDGTLEDLYSKVDQIMQGLNK